MSNQYLNFASQTDDENLLTQVETLPQIHPGELNQRKG